MLVSVAALKSIRLSDGKRMFLFAFCGDRLGLSFSWSC